MDDDITQFGSIPIRPLSSQSMLVSSSTSGSSFSVIWTWPWVSRTERFLKRPPAADSSGTGGCGWFPPQSLLTESSLRLRLRGHIRTAFADRAASIKLPHFFLESTFLAPASRASCANLVTGDRSPGWWVDGHGEEPQNVSFSVWMLLRGPLFAPGRIPVAATSDEILPPSPAVAPVAPAPPTDAKLKPFIRRRSFCRFFLPPRRKQKPRRRILELVSFWDIKSLAIVCVLMAAGYKRLIHFQVKAKSQVGALIHAPHHLHDCMSHIFVFVTISNLLLLNFFPTNRLHAKHISVWISWISLTWKQLHI